MIRFSMPHFKIHHKSLDLYFEALDTKSRKQLYEDLKDGRRIKAPNFGSRFPNTVKEFVWNELDLIDKLTVKRLLNLTSPANPPLKYDSKDGYQRVQENIAKQASSVVEAFLKLAGYDRDLLKPGYTGRFVIHEHDAEKAGKHFDLRLEFPVTSLHQALGIYEGKRIPGTLEPLEKYPDRSGTVYRSFAVKKHTIPTADNKLFIVETENHPIEYGTFKGKITEGYGKGDVDIFDHGRYELIDVEGDKKYVIDFKGKKLNGIYALIKYQNGYLWVKTKEEKKASHKKIFYGMPYRVIKSHQLKEAHDFSCLLCPLPWDVAEEIRAWGKKNIALEDLINDGLEQNIHVTLKYGLHDQDPFELRELIWNFGKIKMSLGKTSIFESPEQDVVKIEVNSPGLHELNKIVSDNFDHTNTHPEYIPHVTVSYVKPGSGKKYSEKKDFNGKKMILTEVIFSGNDNRETNLPFKP